MSLFGDFGTQGCRFFIGHLMAMHTTSWIGRYIGLRWFASRILWIWWPCMSLLLTAIVKAPVRQEALGWFGNFTGGSWTESCEGLRVSVDTFTSFQGFAAIIASTAASSVFVTNRPLSNVISFYLKCLFYCSTHVCSTPCDGQSFKAGTFWDFFGLAVRLENWRANWWWVLRGRSWQFLCLLLVCNFLNVM